MEGKIRDLKLRPAIGGFIICYDEYGHKSRDEFEGMAFIGRKEVVVEDPEEAMAMLMSLHESTGSEEIINGEDSALGGA